MSDNKDSPKPVGINLPLLMYENRLYVIAEGVWHLLGADGMFSPANAETQYILDSAMQAIINPFYEITMDAKAVPGVPGVFMTRKYPEE